MGNLYLIFFILLREFTLIEMENSKLDVLYVYNFFNTHRTTRGAAKGTVGPARLHLILDKILISYKFLNDVFAKVFDG